MKDFISSTLRIIFLLVSFFSFAQDNALFFDGVDDNISFINGPEYSSASNITFEAWINPTTSDGLLTIASWEDGGGQFTEFYINNGVLQLFTDDGFNGGAVTGTGAIVPNQWIHVAFTRTLGSFNFYIDGVVDSVGTPTGEAGTAPIFALGVSSSGTNFFPGLMDEVKVWNSALVPTNIYNALIGNETDLIAYYTFNEISGVDLPDLTTSGFDGILNNFPGPTDPNWQASTALTEIFSVTDNSDASAVSLRQAITDANASIADNVRIEFDLSQALSLTISLATELPTITQAMTIDGRTEPTYDFATETMVTLDLGGVTNGDGFNILSANVDIIGMKILNAVFGVVVNGEAFDNIRIQENIINQNLTTAINIINADFVTIQGNNIGVSGDGLTNQATSGTGIAASGSDNLTIGGDRSLGEGNHIAGSAFSSYLLSISGSTLGTTIHGNIIGASIDGNDITVSRGILINNTDNVTIGTTDNNFRNFIAGIDADAALSVSNGDLVNIINNYIGIGIMDSHTIGNGGTIPAISSSSGLTNFAVDGNVIGGSGDEGIIIGGVANVGSIVNNFIGLAPDGTTAFGNATNGINFTGSSVTNVTVGGSGSENSIAYNSNGIRTDQTSLGTIDIQQNSIFCNTLVGIDISGTPVVPVPSITSISATQISGITTVEDNANILIFESIDGCNDDQGITFVSEGVDAVSGGTWTVSGSFDLSATYTAIVVDDEILADGVFGPSEFSAPFSINRALDFDGTDDFVSIGDHTDFQFGTGDFTVEAWFYFDGVSKKAGVIAKRNPITPFEQFTIQISDGLSGGGAGKKLLISSLPDGRTPSVNDRSVPTSSDLTIGWHHVAMVHDYDTELVLYLDGVNVGSSTTSHGGLTFDIIGQPLTIGSFNGSGYLDGGVDEVRIWNDVRTEVEIRGNLYTTLVGNEANLIAYYRFDQGVDGIVNPGITTLPDRSQNQHDGTLTNFDLGAGDVNISNWTLSNAQKPIVFDATNITTSGFTANWQSVAGATDLLIQVDNDPNFGSPEVDDLSIATGGTASIIQTLSLGVNYYYRIKADVGGSTTQYSLSSSFMVSPGNALDFDGVDDIVTALDNSSLDFGTGDFTVEIWVNKLATTTGFLNTYAIDKWKNSGVNTGENEWTLTLATGSDDDIPAFGIEEGLVLYRVISSDPLPLNEWHHLAGVRAGTELRIYIDGILKGTLTIPPGTSINNVGRDLTIGHSQQALNLFTNAQFDEARVWNVARTQTDIQNNMFTTLIGNETNLVAYYRFDQGTAGVVNNGITTLPDRSQNQNDGTLTNFDVGAADVNISNWVNSAAFIPFAPTNLITTDVSTTQIDLTWTDNSANETDFLIERSDGDNSNFVQIGMVEANATIYSDFSVTPGSGYFYRIIATDGTFNSTPSNEKFGSTITPPGVALDFDSNDDYVRIPDAPALDITGDITISAWIRPDAFVGSFRGIATKFGGSNKSWYFGIRNDQLTTILSSDGSTDDINDSNAGSLFAGTWQHVVFTYNATSTLITFYVNGVDAGTGNHSGGMFSGTSDVVVGAQSDLANLSFDGAIDEVRIWNVVRTQMEIIGDLATPLVGNEANLVAYYRFDQDEPTDILLPDRSTNNNDGIWNGSAGTFTVPQWIVSGAITPEITVYAGVDNTGSELFDDQEIPVNFENVPQSTAKSQTFTIENVGLADLVVSNITTSGGEFSITSGTSFTILPGNTVNFTVELDATTAGIANDFVTIINDDLGEPNFSIPITGTRGTLTPKVWWSDDTSNVEDDISRSNLDGTATQAPYYSGFSVDIRGIAIDETNNMIFWTNTSGQISCGRIGESGFASTGGLIVDESGGPTGFLGLDVDEVANKIYWCDAFNGQIRRVNLDGSNQEVLVTIGSSRDIALDVAGGKMYYLTNASLVPEIWRANLDGTLVENLVSSGTTIFRGLSLDLVNGHIYWTANGVILRANLDGTNQVTISLQLAEPEAIEVDPDNQMIYVVDGTNSEVVRLTYQDDPLEVIQTGALIQNPQYLALDTRSIFGTPPSPPSSLFTTEVSSTQIDLTWSDNSTDETGFTIERSDGNNSSFSVIASVGADVTNYSDNSVTSGNGYFFRVIANNALGDSAPSNEKFGSTITAPGNGLQFDGVDDEMNFSGALNNTLSDFTIEFWAKIPVSNTGQVDYFLQQDPAGGSTPQIVIASVFGNSMYMFLRESNGGTSALVLGTTPINDDNWHHLAYVRQGASLNLYLDGVLEGTNSGFVGDIVFPITSTSDLLGDATLDEFRLWDIALDLTQIQGTSPNTIVGNEPNLVSYYRFDQDEVTDLLLPDRSTNNIKATWSDGGAGSTTPQWVVSGAFTADINPPTAVTQEISVSLDATGNISITPAQVNNSSSDNFTSTSNLVLSLDVTDFDCTNIGTNSVTLTVTDESGKSANATATVTIVDDLAPTVIAQDISVSLDAGGLASILATDIDNGSTDNCSLNLSLDITTFDCTNLGANTVTLTTTDNDGNSANTTATVTIVDDIAPTVIRQDISVSLDAGGLASILATDIDNGSTDNCSLNLSLDITTFDCTNLGANMVTLTATDNDGNTSNATATVTIVDDLAPTVVTQDFTIMLDASGQASIIPDDIDNGSSDNCSFTISLDVTSFDENNFGDNTVTLTGSDDSGNEASATAIVTVQNQAPTIDDQTFDIDELQAAGSAVGTIIATDPDGSSLTFTILSGNTDSGFALNANTGNLTVANSNLNVQVVPVFNLVVEVDDGFGGTSTANVTVNLVNVLGLDLERQLEIYPNPVNELLFIQLKGISLNELEIKMFTISGSQILTSARVNLRSEGVIELDLEHLDPGIYLLKIQNEYTLITKSILVR